MEEKEPGESEPVDLRCSEQSELLSLIISGEEEATQEESDLGGKGKRNRKAVVIFVFSSAAEWMWLTVTQSLSDRQLIRVRDKAMERHGPSVCGSYKQRLNGTQPEQTHH